MPVLSSYRSLFALTGGRYVLIAFLARLPLAMAQMGTLLLVAGASGSYGAGGAAAGALAVTNAIASPLAGGLTDRIGQRSVLLVQSLGGTIGLAALVLLSRTDVSWPVLAVVAGVTGVFLPQVGTLARVRWRALAGPDRWKLVSTAFSYEGAADEASFVLGPALVGAAAALVSPAGALVAAAVLLALFGTAFAVHPTADHVPGTRVRLASPTRLLTPVLVGLALGQLAMGVTFGSVQTGSTALATGVGEPGLAGLLHAILGIGSVVAGLAVAALPARFDLAHRLPVFGAAFTVLALPLLAVSSLGTLIPVLLFLGLAIAPYMITIFSACEQITDSRRLGVAMMVLAAATNLGYALGSSTAGRLADTYGYTGAYAVTVTAAASALVLALALRPALQRRERRIPGISGDVD
ncbi:MFS transporter [Georgenia faecalis]|uniref:MFS transporter n=1 Tax=Georgenia faecalis TaxID=2483799 RepID=A0ABV9DA73_9MICO|nr:MFS transporter [Georgenia faecalis]